MSTQIQTPAITFDVQTATAALHRAAAMARQTAIDTDTWIVVMENDKVVRIPAERLRQQTQDTSHTPTA